MLLPIALQLYTVRDLLEADFAATLHEVARIGYHQVELASLYEFAPNDVRRLCDDAGLTIVAWHVPLDAFTNSHESLILATQALGCRFIVVPWIPPAMRSRAGYHELARTLNVSGRALSQSGITLCYHHHSFEWEPLPGATAADDARGIDILVNATDPDHVQFELDLYWVQHADDDPLIWLDRLSGRVDLLHVKDMADSPDRRFTEVGQGVVDIPAAVAQAERCGVKHLIVEQDGYWINDSPLESAHISLANLQRLAVMH